MALCMLAVIGCNNSEKNTDSNKSEMRNDLEKQKESQWISVESETYSKKNENSKWIMPNCGVAFGKMEPIGKDDEFYCNYIDNIAIQGGVEKSSLVPSLVSTDPVYGITYYVNYGRDYAIYAIKDGKNQKVVDMPASDLYCRDGVLYFLLKSYGIYPIEKDIENTVFEYDPEEGKVCQICSQQGDYIQVYPDGVVINKTDMIPQNENQTIYKQVVSSWFYDFVSELTSPLDIHASNLDGRKGAFLNSNRYNGYFLYTLSDKLSEEAKKVRDLRAQGYQGDVYESSETLLLDIHNNLKGTLLNRLSLPMFCRIRGNLLYYVGWKEENNTRVSCLMSYSLENGETQVITKLPIFADGSFTLVGDVCYLADYGFRISLKNQRADYLMIQELQEVGLVKAFYTDGERIFLFNGKKLWEYREKEIGTGRVDGMVSGDYYCDRYTYELVELGETYIP